jgi:hypothetical protein
MGKGILKITIKDSPEKMIDKKRKGAGKTRFSCAFSA